MTTRQGLLIKVLTACAVGIVTQMVVTFLLSYNGIIHVTYQEQVINGLLYTVIWIPLVVLKRGIPAVIMILGASAQVSMSGLFLLLLPMAGYSLWQQLDAAAAAFLYLLLVLLAAEKFVASKNK